MPPRSLALLALAYLAYRAEFPTPLEPVYSSIESIVGGAPPYACALLGLAAGLAFASGNAIGLFGALISGHLAGCF